MQTRKRATEYTHSALCDLAVDWLKRPQSRDGHGCQIAMSEVPTGWVGEIPDAIGFRAQGQYDDGSVVVEVKTSRADFLADRKKPHRSGEVNGVGRWRYFMCPEGLIQPEELPEQWGLLYVTKRGGIRPIAGPVTTRHYHDRKTLLKQMAFDDRDIMKEHFVLVRLLTRVGDVESLNKRLREAEGRASKADNQSARLTEELRKERAKRRRLQLMHQIQSETQPIPKRVGK
ncbi:adenylosuccinate synthase [Marinobacterium sp. BA1]|uniref:adenylosuccinate synthase n=1 Tax=Marinobacterium sp. BA1 TaxID=3138931 RepID=UPI0032E7C47F